MARRVVVAISLIAIAGCSSPPSRRVEASKTCVPNYTGETNDAGQAHGTGAVVWANCNQYSGLWSEGSMVDGTYTWADGSKYEGQWKKGDSYLQHGQGRNYFVGGNVYEGQWKDGEMHGQGRYTHAAPRSVFVGEFKNNEKHYGVWEWEDGSRYEGEFDDGFVHGQGTHTKPDGYKYVGEFYTGEKTGTATITYPDGRKFVGSVRAGVPGEGTYTGPWPEGVSEVLDAERRKKQRSADEQNRIEKRLAACDSFGFERGTEAHAECAMKLYMNEQSQGAQDLLLP